MNTDKIDSGTTGPVASASRRAGEVTNLPAETIFAPATAAGRAGVTVIRVSGPRSQNVLECLAGRVPPARRASLAKLRDPATGETLDRALVLWLPGPGSFTGEDTVELSLHGGRAVVGGVLEALGQLPGLRLAEPGEFTRRAFDNGRIDLTRAEGLADLIDAETPAQRRRALAEADGASARLYGGWHERLIDALASVEASLDFADEPDVAHPTFRLGVAEAARLAGSLRRHLADGQRGEIVREGFRVALLGAPNAGKSSLLNALARRDVAIVSSEPGTTRDVLEARLEIAGHLAVVSDTAGLRAAAGEIEREGMRRAALAAEAAHLVLWLVEPGAEGEARWPPAFVASGAAGAGGPSILRVASKSDCKASDAANEIDPAGFAAHVSAVTGEGLDALGALIAREMATRTGSADAASDPIAVANVRHRLQLEAALGHLERGLALVRWVPRDEGAEGTPDRRRVEPSSDETAHEHEKDRRNGSEPEAASPDGSEALFAEDLRLAAHALGRITGRVDVEDLLGRIFSRFCIGK